MKTKRAPVIPATAAVLIVLLLGAFGLAGWSEEAVRIVVRSTAKIAIVLFAAAFSASSLHTLWRSEATRRLLVERRGIGLAFALSHGLHLVALVVLALVFPHPFVDDLSSVTLVGGGLAYAFLLAMAATSNDASVHRLGAKRWRLLHTVGGWYIWLIFMQSYVPRAIEDPAYTPFAAVVLAVPGLRIARRVRLRVGAAGDTAAPRSPAA